MSLPTYVINFEELIEMLEMPDLSQISTSFPELLALLREIRDELGAQNRQYDGYRQRIKGFHISPSTNKHDIEWVAEKDCALTGVAFSHSHVEGVDDYFSISVSNIASEVIFTTIYLKDSLQHKYFEKFFPIPAGSIVKITHYNPSLTQKHIWYDLEYLEKVV